MNLMYRIPGTPWGMEWVGGASYFTTKLLELKSANPDSLIMDAGDISEGNPLGDLRGNGGMIDFYNELDRKLKLLGGPGHRCRGRGQP